MKAEGITLRLTYRKGETELNTQVVLSEKYIAKHKNQDATCEYVENIARQAWIEMCEQLKGVKDA